MRSLLCENFRSESFPNFDRKFVKRRVGGNKGDTGRPGDSEIELFSRAFVGNFFHAIGQAWGTFCRSIYSFFARTEKSFRQRLSDERARSDSRMKITLRMKPRESDVDREPRYSQVGG